jgi:hypothetical protein
MEPSRIGNVNWRRRTLWRERELSKADLAPGAEVRIKGFLSKLPDRGRTEHAGSTSQCTVERNAPGKVGFASVSA